MTRTMSGRSTGRNRIRRGTRAGGRWARRIAVWALLLGVWNSPAQEASPVTIHPEIRPLEHGRELRLSFHVPKNHHLYADRLSVDVAGDPVQATLPDPVMVMDKHSGRERGMYQEDFVASIPLPATAGDVSFAIHLQGCNEAECYFPETREWRIVPDQTIVSVNAPQGSSVMPSAAVPLAAGFQLSQRASGFMDKREFLDFLATGQDGVQTGAASRFAGMGAVATIGLILLGGMALNLTPCVLPMIPINLAILGAGVNGGSRRRGFLLGSAYGSGMAIAYGGLGLVVVLTGSQFGTLNSSPWFNFGIAIVFSVLGLAMFDRIAIDFSRFQRPGANARKGNAALVGATTMGAVSALLAGACVAPVVIGVLLLANTSYQNGNVLGLLFPFVLGLGMALPWPLAASGLSFLPKPGIWMTRVKYGFGVVIFLFAAWYGWLGWSLSGWSHQQQVFARDTDNDVQTLKAALESARKGGKPVLVDFWASWCKNCSAMEHTTLQNDAVKERLSDFQVVRFQAERLDDPNIKPVLDEFQVMGLPTFIVLHPDSPDTAQPAELHHATP